MDSENAGTGVATQQVPWRLIFLEFKGQAFGSTARLHVLRQGSYDRTKPLLTQLRLQGLRRPVHKDMALEVDGIAGEKTRILGANRDAFVGRYVVEDGLLARCIESAWIIKQKSAFERAKTGVEVVEIRIDQVQGHRAAVKGCRKEGRCFL